MGRQIPKRNHFICNEKSLYQKMRVDRILLINKLSLKIGIQGGTFYSEVMLMIRESEQ